MLNNGNISSVSFLMSLHTPIDRHYRFGELFGIRSSYRDMNEAIQLDEMEKCFYDEMMKYIIESGNMEKIERFARKNRTLCNFAQSNAIKEAYNNAELSTSSLNIPKLVKQKAEKKARTAVSNKAISIKTNSYRLPSFDEPIAEPTIYEAIEDFGEENDKENIDNLIMSVARNNGILNGTANSKKKTDVDSDDEGKSITEPIRHNYSIQSIIVEAVAGNSKKTQLIPATTVYEESPTNDKTFLNATIKNVTDGINAACGINFTENDYIWLASGRPVPHFKGELAVNSDLVKGNRLLNAYFGPAGTYKDYLYKADGTPRIEQSKSSSMDEIDKDVNSIQSYPIIKVYATVVSWDNVNGKDTLREITADDFYGTSIKFIS